jgi:DNA polymerase-1
MNETLFLIDANSIIHRCFHALPPLTTKDGSPGQALYGLSSVLLKLWHADHPTYAAALFDRPEPTFRKKEYPEYKATRPPAAEGLIEQIIAAHGLFEKFGIRVLEAPGFEADDLIATLAQQFGGRAGLRTVVLTGDYDTLQLVRGEDVTVRIFRTGISDTVAYNDAAVHERYGLSPSQLTDYKAFVGDVSDNVKGVPGIGPKTAASLLQQFKTIEGVYEHAATDKKLSAKLGDSFAHAKFARHLVTLNVDAPIHVREIGELRMAVSENTLQEYFSALGFESLTKRMAGGGSGVKARKTAQNAVRAKRGASRSANPQGSMF